MTRNTENRAFLASWQGKSLLPERHMWPLKVQNENVTVRSGSIFATPPAWFHYVSLWVLLITLGCGSKQTLEKPESQARSWSVRPTEIWDVHYLGGQKIGHTVTRREFVEREAFPEATTQDTLHDPLVRIQATMVQQIRRFGEVTKTELQQETVESLDGEIHRCRWSMTSGSGTIQTVLQQQNGLLSGQVLSGQQNAGEARHSIQLQQTNWTGYFAVERSLRTTLMAPGEQRTVPGLLPFYNVVSETVLEAGQPSRTSLLNGDAELLPVKCTLHIGQTSEIHTLWLDKNGEILKSELDGLNQISYRTDRETALRPNETEFDLGLQTSIPVSGLSGNPHQSEFARYRITATEPIDVTKLFTQDRTQIVVPAGASALELTIDAQRPGPSITINSRAKSLCLTSSPWIQSDDRRIVELAAMLPAGTLAQIATAAETLVREHVEDRNFSHTMATAAEVAETRAGDCSEHALLLAAVCRARDIPTRIAIGLVYVPATHSFAYHMWNEAFVGDRWMILDATLEKTGAGHLKMADTAFENTASLAKLAQLMTAMGKLEIEWLEMR